MTRCPECEGYNTHRLFCDKREFKTFAERAAYKIYKDLTGRRGLHWDGIDYDVQEEIFQSWVKIIQQEVGV